MEEIWETVKADLKNHISPSGYALWVDPLQTKTGPEGELQLLCPNLFAQRWIQSHYLPLIHRALENLGAGLSVKLSLATPLGVRALAAPAAPQPALPLLSESRASGRKINNAFTFDRFVVGSSNRLAFQASQALACNDTFYKGILYLSSGPGLGKSHLSQAVGNFLHHSYSQGGVLYISAEDFANDMVRSLKNGQMSRFKKRYREECEILLLEEVQFLSSKEKIQAELCYTLDTLLDRQKRIVFTSCYLPGEISQISKELRSRLTGGLITPIGPPDFPTRVKILARKAEERGVNVPMRVLEYMAEHLVNDVRRLESALDCLAARSSLLNEPVSLRVAQEVLHDLQAVERRLSVPQIQKIVGDYYRVGLHEMLGRSRQKKLVRARQMALYFARLYTQKTMTELGRLFQRSHASVVHALQTLERDRQVQARVAEEVTFLEEKLAQAQVRRGSQREPSPHIDA
jgi:chromosomal replication initiator protein